MPKATGQKTTNPQKKELNQAKFGKKVRKAIKSNPRFLFRVWREDSGGYVGLNTVRAITPHAYFDGAQGPTSLYDMSPDIVQQLVTGHLGGEEVQTVFSSWSHSLAFVLSWAVSWHRQGRKPYISVLDTKKLPEANVVIHTEPLDKILDALTGEYTGHYPEEFLAFGVITNEAYSSISYEEMLRKAQSPRRKSLNINLTIGEMFASVKDVEARISMVIRIASLLGENCDIAIAASLIDIAAHDEDERKIMIEYIGSKSSLQISEDFKDDPLIFNQDIKHYGKRESERAARNLRELVLARYPPTVTPATKARTEMEDKEQAAEAEAAMEHVENSDRVPEDVKGTYFEMVKVPRMVKELEITMKGWMQVEGEDGRIKFV